MLRHLYPDAKARSRAIGVWAATSGFALAAGPVVGGVLVGVWNWRGIFWFNLAFGLAALIVAAIILPESADPTAARVNTVGTLLGAGTLAAFVFAIIDAESAGFGSAGVIVLLCLSAVLAAAFVWWERRAVLAGPRWSITVGCLLLACGLFLTDGYLSPHQDYGPLMVALALAGIGIGTTVVPITSSVLAAVPPERSGMAASAANTSREIGAVTGVAVLGSLVISQLRSSLTAQLHHLGIPAQFQALVINAIETGQIPKNTSAYAGFGQIVQEVISAAYTAFHHGLHVALYLSAGLALAAGLLAFITLPSRPAAGNFTVPPRQNDRGPSRLLQGALCLYPSPGSGRRTWR